VTKQYLELFIDGTMMHVHKLSCLKLLGMVMIPGTIASKQGGSKEKTTLCSEASIMIQEPIGNGGYKTKKFYKVKKLSFDSDTQTFRDLEMPDTDLNELFGVRRPIIEVESDPEAGTFSIIDTAGNKLRIGLAYVHLLQAPLWEVMLSDSVDQVTPTFYNAMWKDAFEIEKSALGLTYENCFQYLDVSTESGVIFFAKEFQTVYRNGGKTNANRLKAAPENYVLGKLQDGVRTCIATPGNCPRAFQLLVGDFEKLRAVFEGEFLDKELLAQLNSGDLWRNYLFHELKREIMKSIKEISRGRMDYRQFGTRLACGYLPSQILLLNDYVKNVGLRETLARELGKQICVNYGANLTNDGESEALIVEIGENVNGIIQSSLKLDR